MFLDQVNVFELVMDDVEVRFVSDFEELFESFVLVEEVEGVGIVELDYEHAGVELFVDDILELFDVIEDDDGSKVEDTFADFEESEDEVVEENLGYEECYLGAEFLAGLGVEAEDHQFIEYGCVGAEKQFECDIFLAENEKDDHEDENAVVDE